MDEPSTSTATSSEQVTESVEPSTKKRKISPVAPEPPKLSAALEAEFEALRNQWKPMVVVKAATEDQPETVNAEAPTASQPEMVKVEARTPSQLLRRQVPRNMIRSDKFIGNQHVALANLISNEVVEDGKLINKGVGFESKPPLRLIVGIVQPFGAGKTKTALKLSDAFVVLPIQWAMDKGYHPLKVALENMEKARFDSINLATVTLGAIENFSSWCKRLTELALISVAAVFDMCASQDWFDPRDKEHRLQFALLAVSAGSVVISEIVNWFEKHIEETNDETQFKLLRERVLSEVGAVSGLRLVFVMDEVQKLFGECRGYFLHEEYKSLPESVALGNWNKETVDKTPTGKSGRCTDLFYQLGCVMKDWMGVKCAFVLCSTMYSTWTQIQSMKSPVYRDLLCRFTDTHWLSPSDCKELIQHYFAVDDQHLDALDLTVCSRPAFACEFVMQLSSNLDMLNSTPLNVADWLKKSYDEAVEIAELRLGRAIDIALLKIPMAMDYLMTHIRLCAGIMEVASTSTSRKSTEVERVAYELKRWEDEVELVSLGLLKLKGSIYRTHKVEVADPLTEVMVLHRYARQDTRGQAIELNAVRETLAKGLTVSLAQQDTSHKGFAFEQVLAYLALQGLIRVPKYAADGTVTGECIKSTAEFAAHYKQLELKIESLTEKSEPSFVCDLLSGRQVPEYVYLPTTSCKPDVLFRGCKMTDRTRGGAVNVVIQSKFEDKVLDYSEFVKALATLDPDKMYGDSEEKMKAWQERRGTLREVEFMRIVFAAAGFNAKVQHVVHEYNLQQARRATATNKPSLIHLLNLDDVQNWLGDTLYYTAKCLIPSTEVRRNLVVHNEMPRYESAWKHAAQVAMTKNDLVKLCRFWGILPDKDENTRMSEEELRTALQNHEKELEENTQKLAISLDVLLAARCSSNAASAQATSE